MIGCGGRLRGVVGLIPGIGKDIEVRGFCDPSEKSIAASKERFGSDIKVFSDYRALARDPDIDWPPSRPARTSSARSPWPPTWKTAWR